MVFTETLLKYGKRSLTLGFDGNLDIFWHCQSKIEMSCVTFCLLTVSQKEDSGWHRKLGLRQYYLLFCLNPLLEK